MKLADLGLKTKPTTKYFDGGYVSFQTKEGELFYKIIRVIKDHQGTLFNSKVYSGEELKTLLTIKTLKDVMGVFN